ncbi:hypothetical protein JT359_12450 [Candidatus Poribacteria bacterium]|nr:hypothetical protein [Candidatus Poribacteria bacterium]
MTANSVTGSFRGIEVSFSFNGPNIMMSVQNKEDIGRRLRVMYQQQPSGGRVNWVSFQLSEKTQNVLVPPDVIQSHRLAFYVDQHEPISTYTTSILEELDQIKGQMEIDGKVEDEVEQIEEVKDDIQQDIMEHLNVTDTNLSNANGNGNDNHSLPSELNPDSEVSETLQPKEQDESVDNQSEIEPLETLDSESLSTIESKLANLNSPQDNNQKKNSTNLDIPEYDESSENEVNSNNDQPTVDDVDNLPKRKAQYVGPHPQNTLQDIRFRIKVPSIPKSSSKQPATFLPPQPVLSGRRNARGQSIFKQLSGVLSLSNNKSKKEYYQEQNRSLYEKFHSDLEQLENDYNNGSGITIDDWDSNELSEEEAAVLVLNLMVNEIVSWKKSAKQGTDTKETLAAKLEEIEVELKQTLKQTRGMTAPSPTLFPDRVASSEQDLADIQRDCETYLERFTEKLSKLELQHAEKVKLPAFKRFLVEFVKDRLFPIVVEFSSLASVQPRLNWFLDLVDCELIPIEPGKTKISSELHEVKEKRRSDCDADTVVEVITPGIQSKDGNRIIQSAVVVQSE